jgi:hypothetical protein
MSPELPPEPLRPITAPTPTADADRHSGDYALEREPDAERVLRLSATFSSEERKGPWHVPDVIEAEAVLGSVELDLRGALVTSDMLEVEYHVVLGSLEIIVPPGVEVVAENENFMGSFRHKRLKKADPVGAGFVLRLRGTNWLGSVEVIEKAMPSEGGTLQAMSRWLRAR